MAVTTIRSNECAWHQTKVMLLGRTIKGIRGWEYKETIEKEHIYGAGQEPIDINEGNIKYEGNIKVLGFESDALNKAAQKAGFENIARVPHEAIVLTIKYQKNKLDPVTLVNVSGVSFTETGSSMEQGAKMREVTLPFIALNIKTVNL